MTHFSIFARRRDIDSLVRSAASFTSQECGRERTITIASLDDDELFLSGEGSLGSIAVFEGSCSVNGTGQVRVHPNTFMTALRRFPANSFVQVAIDSEKAVITTPDDGSKATVPVAVSVGELQLPPDSGKSGKYVFLTTKQFLSAYDAGSAGRGGPQCKSGIARHVHATLEFGDEQNRPALRITATDGKSVMTTCSVPTRFVRGEFVPVLLNAGTMALARSIISSGRVIVLKQFEGETLLSVDSECRTYHIRQAPIGYVADQFPVDRIIANAMRLMSGADNRVAVQKEQLTKLLTHSAAMADHSPDQRLSLTRAVQLETGNNTLRATVPGLFEGSIDLLDGSRHTNGFSAEIRWRMHRQMFLTAMADPLCLATLRRPDRSLCGLALVDTDSVDVLPAYLGIFSTRAASDIQLE